MHTSRAAVVGHINVSEYINVLQALVMRSCWSDGSKKQEAVRREPGCGSALEAVRLWPRVYITCLVRTWSPEGLATVRPGAPGEVFNAVQRTLQIIAAALDDGALMCTTRLLRTSEAHEDLERAFPRRCRRAVQGTPPPESIPSGPPHPTRGQDHGMRRPVAECSTGGV